MPTIQTELRVQIEGSGSPALVRRTSLQVGSCQQITLSVDGVKPNAAPPAGAKAAKERAPQKQMVQATYRPDFKNVKFVAIYDAGQASGLKVKVGASKFTALTQPLVFMDRLAAGFSAKTSVVLQNESSLPRTAVMLVGWDLPKEARTSVLVAAGAGAAARAPKKSVRKAKGKRAARSK